MESGRDKKTKTSRTEEKTAMSRTEQKTAISRRKFLQLCGSVLAGGTIVGLSGVLFHKRSTAPAEALPSSPYKLVASFRVPETVEAFQLANHQITVAASEHIYTYDRTGNLLNTRPREISDHFTPSAPSSGITYTDGRVYCIEGDSRRLLLDSHTLGDAPAVCDIQFSEDKIIVASKDLISTYQYDKALAARNTCFGCNENCPLNRFESA